MLYIKNPSPCNAFPCPCTGTRCGYHVFPPIIVYNKSPAAIPTTPNAPLTPTIDAAPVNCAGADVSVPLAVPVCVPTGGGMAVLVGKKPPVLLGTSVLDPVGYGGLDAL